MAKYRVGISERRRAWVVEWATKVLEYQETDTDFDSGLGRLSFVCGAILYDRPFLAPLYSWAAATRRAHGGKANLKKLPPYVRFILWFLRSRIMERRTINCLRGRPRPAKDIERFRTDAKAEGDLVTIGGYETQRADGTKIEHAEARWFYMKLDRDSAPCAFAKVEPFRTISSLEMLGFLMGVLLFLDVGDGCKEGLKGTLSVGGLTDNKGNSFAITKLLTTKWSLMAFLAELAVQLESKGVAFEMSWVPREQNSEADSITNGKFEWLSPGNRIGTSMEKLPFLVLHSLLEKDESFYEGLEVVNEEAPAPAKSDPRTLRVRDPWD